jgi:hypothetical protein
MVFKVSLRTIVELSYDLCENQHKNKRKHKGYLSKNKFGCKIILCSFVNTSPSKQKTKGTPRKENASA